MLFCMGPRNLEEEGAPGSAGVSDALLKRSSSMFIPQLQSQAEPRTTKSSSMQISLQRSSASQENGQCMDSPPEYPEDPAPAYTEPEEGWYNPPCPSYHRSASLSSLMVDQTTQGTEPGCPKRRVFCVRPYDIMNTHSKVLIPNGGPPGSCIGGLCIQQNAGTDGLDVQKFTIVPYTPDGQNGACRWSVLPTTDGTSGTRRLVFQLQKDRRMSMNANGQREMSSSGHTGSRNCREAHYPRIRLERSTSQPIKTRTVPSRPGSMPDLHASVSEMETKTEEVEDGSRGFMFNIRKEPNVRQPKFKIYFSQGGDHCSNSVQDVSIGKEPPRNSPQVIDQASKIQHAMQFPILFIYSPK